MHVVVITQIARKECEAGSFVYTFVPMVFAFVHFWVSYWIFLINPRYSYDINYLFENHAFHQYHQFLVRHADELKAKPAESAFLAWYGRTPANQDIVSGTAAATGIGVEAGVDTENAIQLAQGSNGNQVNQMLEVGALGLSDVLQVVGGGSLADTTLIQVAGNGPVNQNLLNTVLSSTIVNAINNVTNNNNVIITQNCGSMCNQNVGVDLLNIAGVAQLVNGVSGNVNTLAQVGGITSSFSL
jgi:hypothetical protein